MIFAIINVVHPNRINYATNHRLGRTNWRYKKRVIDIVALVALTVDASEPHAT